MNEIIILNIALIAFGLVALASSITEKVMDVREKRIKRGKEWLKSHPNSGYHMDKTGNFQKIDD